MYTSSSPFKFSAGNPRGEFESSIGRGTKDDAVDDFIVVDV